MTLYLVQARGEDAEALARASFVPDTFSWGAFFFGPLWLIYRRLWAALAIWIGVALAVRFVVAPHIEDGASLVLALLVALYLGLEGNRWRQEKLARRAAIADLVEASSRARAEAIFYARYGENAT